MCVSRLCRQFFEKEYQKQVDLDMRELKQIGELKHNYEQMTQGITVGRAREFTQLKQLLVSTIRDNDIYEREESVRRILTKQINTLKECKSHHACTKGLLKGFALDCLTK